MRFLNFYTPEFIAKMCKEGKVKVTITILDPIGEDTVYFENGHHVTITEDKIISQSTREIRSWSDLFQFDGDKSAMYLTDKEQESLK
jgi:hypothetical protein